MPLKQHDINPKTCSRDAVTHWLLRRPQVDTLLLVDISSTRSSHTWTLTVNGLLSTYIAPIPPSHFHSAWQYPVQPMWTNSERHGTSSASVLPAYFSNVPTARNDNLNVQADGRLAAHLCETPAPHIMKEDAEPNEELTGNDFTCSHDTTTAFQELLTMIDSTTKELSDVLSTKHHAALTQLPLTYPWARLVLDMKELLLSFDRHLITCLIANQVQGNDPLHPGTVLSSFLHHLGQLILLIIAPHDTDDAPPFLQHSKVYGIEFWHAHLNHTCTRFAVSHGPDRLLGNQICHWTAGTSETCMKVTYLVVFLPLALGAYVLSRTMALSGLKLWGCTSQIPLRNGCCQVSLASITAQTLIFPATVKLLFLLFLNATFAANSQSLNLRNFLSPGRLKMKRYWILLPRHAVKWNVQTNLGSSSTLYCLQYQYWCFTRSCLHEQYSSTFSAYSGYWT